jgi:hypothetical protein
VGINLFKTSPYAKGTQQNNPLSTLINPLLSTSQSAFNQLTTFIAKKLGLQDYYSIHMMDYCFGSYNLHSTSIGTTVSGCSTRTVLFAFDPMPILQKALDKAGIGIAVEQLNWPQALQDGISQLKLIAHIAFATYSLAISLCFCTIIACGYWMSPYSHGSRRIVALTLTISGAAFGSLMCASVMVTILMEKGEFHAGKYGRLMGITVFRGNGYLGLTWAAMLMALAGMVTVGGECCRRRNRMAFRVFFEK